MRMHSKAQAKAAKPLFDVCCMSVEERNRQKQVRELAERDKAQDVVIDRKLTPWQLKA